MDIAEHPDVLQVGDGEGIGRAESGDAGSVGDLLVGDDTRDRGTDFYNAAGLVEGGVAEDVELFGGGFDVDLGLGLGVLRDLKIVEGDGTFVVEDLGAVELRVGELLVGDLDPGTARYRARLSRSGITHPGERARAVHRQLSQGGRRHRIAVHRPGDEGWCAVIRAGGCVHT